MSGWIREPKPHHRCSEEQPEVTVLSSYDTGVWRCPTCFKLWVIRAGWSTLKFRRTAPRWRRANPFEASRWFLAGFPAPERRLRFSLFRLVPIWKDKVDRMRSTAWTRSAA